MVCFRVFSSQVNQCFQYCVHPLFMCLSLHQVMGLHLPEAPPPDSDEEEDPEGAAALRSRASIPMDAGQYQKYEPSPQYQMEAKVKVLLLRVRCRPRGAGEEDDGGSGVAVSRCAAVGQRDLRRPVDRHGPTHAAEPTERRSPAPRPQEQRQRTLKLEPLVSGRLVWW